MEYKYNNKKQKPTQEHNFYFRFQHENTIMGRSPLTGDAFSY